MSATLARGRHRRDRGFPDRVRDGPVRVRGVRGPVHARPAEPLPVALPGRCGSARRRRARRASGGPAPARVELRDRRKRRERAHPVPLRPPRCPRAVRRPAHRHRGGPVGRRDGSAGRRRRGSRAGRRHHRRAAPSRPGPGPRSRRIRRPAARRPALGGAAHHGPGRHSSACSSRRRPSRPGPRPISSIGAILVALAVTALLLGRDLAGGPPREARPRARGRAGPATRPAADRHRGDRRRDRGRRGVAPPRARPGRAATQQSLSGLRPVPRRGAGARRRGDRAPGHPALPDPRAGARLADRSPPRPRAGARAAQHRAEPERGLPAAAGPDAHGRDRRVLVGARRRRSTTARSSPRGRRSGRTTAIEAAPGGSLGPEVDPATVPGVEAVAAAALIEPTTVDPRGGRAGGEHLVDRDRTGGLRGGPCRVARRAAAARPAPGRADPAGERLRRTGRSRSSSRAACRTAGSRCPIGEVFRLGVGERPLTLSVVGFIDDFPGRPARNDVRRRARWPRSSTPSRAADRRPTVLFVRGPAEHRRGLRAAMRRRRRRRPVVRRATTCWPANAPRRSWRRSGRGSAVALGAAAVYAVLAVVAVVALDAQRRARELAYLRTLGLSEGQAVPSPSSNTRRRRCSPWGSASCSGLAWRGCWSPGWGWPRSSTPGRPCSSQVEWTAVAAMGLSMLVGGRGSWSWRTPGWPVVSTRRRPCGSATERPDDDHGGTHDRLDGRDRRPAERGARGAPAARSVRRAGADRVRQPRQDLQGRGPRGRRAPGARPARGVRRVHRPGRRLRVPARARSSTCSAGSTCRRPDAPSSRATSSPSSGPREQTRYLRQVIGFVWQQTGRNLLPYLTALENVALPMAFDGVPADIRATRARELLRQVGLDERRDHRPRAPLRRGAAAGGDRRGPRQRARGHPRRRAHRRAGLGAAPPRSSSCSAGSTGSWA